MSARDNQAQGNRPQSNWNPFASSAPSSRPTSGRATNASRQPSAPAPASRGNSPWLQNTVLQAAYTMPFASRDALAEKDLNDTLAKNYLDEMAWLASADASSGSGERVLAPLVLPRMAMPSPESLAAQLYAAVGAATSPYQQAIQQLAGQQATAQTGIKQADQTAGESMNQATRDWRAATGQISGQIADVYRTALSSLAGFVGGNNAAMMNAGFAPSDTGGTAAMGRLAGLGASAQEASLARRDMGEQAVRGDRVARSQITQAGNQSMLSSYAQVLGGLNLQKAAAEAAARAEQVNREFALRQEVDRINFDAASQEAAANR
jgi:hypothetical protein